MKQVLVIDKEDHFRCAVDALTKLGVGFEIPGKLLAEFNGRIETRSDAEQLGAKVIGAIDDLRDGPGQDRTILILACADEGSASDEGSEEKNEKDI